MNLIVNFLLLFVISCGKINISPYASNISISKLNEKNLKKINNMNINKIAFIADIHNSYDDLKDFLKKDNFDFFIVVGDFSNLGLKNEYELFLKILDKSKKPYLIIPGNHDLLNNGEKLFDKVFGLTNFFIDVNNYRLFLLNNNNNNNWESQNLFSFNWLKSNIIKESIIIAHVPYDDTDRFSKDQINEKENFFNNNILFYINGHKHHNQIVKKNNFHHITVGSLNNRIYGILNLNEKNYINYYF